MLVELVNQVAFPIAAFVLMFHLYREERREHREERSRWLESIEEHTDVLRNLKHDVRDVATDGGEIKQPTNDEETDQ